MGAIFECRSGGVDDRKEFAPWADRPAVLLGHRRDDLTQVVQIVYHPRGEELAERHLPEGGMDTPSPQVLDLDQCIQRLEIRGPHGGEPTKKIAELPVPEESESRFSVDGLEDAFRAVLRMILVRSIQSHSSMWVRCPTTW
jgi:hypothetical protein